MTVNQFGNNGKNDNYVTPKWLKQFFSFCFEPNPINPEGLREFDGLGDWDDWTFVNIPYSDPMTWILKALEENRKGKRIVLLVKVDTSAKWWIELVNSKRAHFFYHIGRIYFNDSVRTPFPSALVFLP